MFNNYSAGLEETGAVVTGAVVSVNPGIVNDGSVGTEVGVDGICGEGVALTP